MSDFNILGIAVYSSLAGVIAIGIWLILKANKLPIAAIKKTPHTTNKQQLFSELADRIAFWESKEGDDAKEYATAYQYLLHNFSMAKEEKPVDND